MPRQSTIVGIVPRSSDVHDLPRMREGLHYARYTLLLDSKPDAILRPRVGRGESRSAKGAFFKEHVDRAVVIYGTDAQVTKALATPGRRCVVAVVSTKATKTRKKLRLLVALGFECHLVEKPEVAHRVVITDSARVAVQSFTHPAGWSRTDCSVRPDGTRVQADRIAPPAPATEE